MIQSRKLLLVGEFDLKRQAPKLSLEWTYKDFNINVHKEFRESDMVVGIDEQGNVKILKNRWGGHGVIVSEDTLAELLEAKKELEQLKNEKHQSDNSPKKKSFMARIFRANFWPFN